MDNKFDLKKFLIENRQDSAKRPYKEEVDRETMSAAEKGDTDATMAVALDQALNEEDIDFTDTGMVRLQDEGYLTIDSEDIDDPDNLEKQTEGGDIINFRGNKYLVIDKEYFDFNFQGSDNHLLVRIEEEE